MRIAFGMVFSKKNGKVGQANNRSAGGHDAKPFYRTGLGKR
jgi:hypothetical protein